MAYFYLQAQNPFTKWHIVKISIGFWYGIKHNTKTDQTQQL